MKKLIIFNWKLNPQKYSEAEKIIKMFLDLLKKYRKRPPAGGAPGRAKKDELIICPPFIYLLSLSSLISHVSYLKLGSQDAFWKNDGAYTGEVSPEMLKNLGVEYTIIGHSERRQHLNETDEIINEKVKTALGAGLKVILCVGEPHRATSGKRQEISKTKSYVKRQLEKDLKGVKNMSRVSSRLSLVIAYEPIWAIGTGRPCRPEDALEIIIFIKKILNSKFQILDSRVLYGGSVDGNNIGDFVKYKEIDGVLVGGASLNPKDVKKILSLKYGR